MGPAVHTELDPARRAATITTTFTQSVEAVWTLWSDPAKLARWWGPPGVRLTVDHHDLRPGGRVEVAAHPGTTVIRARWAVHAVEAPHALRFTFTSDGLAATEVDVRIDPVAAGTGTGTGTTMVLTARFATDADLARAQEIGFVAGVARSCAAAPGVL